LLAGCGGSGGAGAGAPATPVGTVAAAGETARIIVRDNAFEPMTVTATANQPVTVVFVNEGQNVHEVEIEDLIPETKIQPGETKQFTVTPKQQSYKLYCEIHEDSGMVGEFVGQ
jgi:plastocyanin